MKKIFTLLFAVGLVGSVFAQVGDYGRRYYENNTNRVQDYGRVDAPQYYDHMQGNHAYNGAAPQYGDVYNDRGYRNENNQDWRFRNDYQRDGCSREMAMERWREHERLERRHEWYQHSREFHDRW